MQTLHRCLAVVGGTDRGLAEIAGRQHGIVARRQLEGLGLTGRRSIDGSAAGASIASIPASTPWDTTRSRSGGGGWRRCSPRGREPSSAIGRRRRCGGSGDRGRGRPTSRCRGKSRSQRSINRHFGALPVDEVTIRDGIPVTSAARAVLDLAADKGEAAAESALREMEYLGIYGPVSFPALLDRHPHHRGATIVAQLPRTPRDDPGGRIRSPLEELFLPFLDAHRIPRPRLNAWLSVGDDRFQVDCLWPDARLVGELDGFQSHGTKRAFRAGPQARPPPRGGELPRRAHHRRPAHDGTRTGRDRRGSHASGYASLDRRPNCPWSAIEGGVCDGAPMYNRP